MKQYDNQILDQYVADGKLICQSHPTLPLKIYKYSVETVFSRAWDEITTAARGLVVDTNTGLAYTNPIKKFHNIEELPTLGIELPNEPYEILDKVDGSCIEVFRYDGELVVCTLGSFQSDQAKIAEILLDTKYKDNQDLIIAGDTWIFELLVPENRIVLNYGDERKLVLLAIRDDDNDYAYYSLGYVWPDVVEKIDKTIEEILLEKKREDFTNKEGFVIKFESGFRVKVKYEEYFRLHRIITGCTKHFVWEYLRDGKQKENILINVPNEFFQTVSLWDLDIRSNYELKEKKAKELFSDIFVPSESRKEFAMKALLHTEFSSVLFKMLEGKDYRELIWKQIEPRATEGISIKFNSFKQLNDNA
jgi:RNA ligase